MAFLIDKVVGGVKRAIGPKQLTAAEAARERDYSIAADKYRKRIFKWLYVDHVPEKAIKDAGLWIPHLLQVKTANMGGPTPGAGPIIPVLGVGSSAGVSGVTTEEEAKHVAEIEAATASIQADLDATLAEMREGSEREGREREEKKQTWAESEILRIRNEWRGAGPPKATLQDIIDDYARVIRVGNSPQICDI